MHCSSAGSWQRPSHQLSVFQLLLLTVQQRCFARRGGLHCLSIRSIGNAQDTCPLLCAVGLLLAPPQALFRGMILRSWCGSWRAAHSAMTTSRSW